MRRILVLVLTLTLLAVAACTPSARPATEPAPPTTAFAIPIDATPTPAPAAALAVPDVARIMSDQLKSKDASQARPADRELTNWARDAGGLRAYLGPQADEIFDLADQAETAAAQDLLRQLQSGSKPKGMPAPLPPHWGGRVGTGALENLMSLLTVLLQLPGNLESPRNGNTSPLTSTNEFDRTVGENARAHAKVTSTVTGSKIQAQVEMTIRVEKDGKVYEEQASGKLSVNMCPDPEGNVPLDLDLQTRAGVSAGGYGLKFTDHAIGHVDDEANLTSIDQETQTEVSFTKGKNWLTGAPDTAFAQVNERYTLVTSSKDPKGISITGLQASVPRSSFLVSRDVVENAAKTGVNLALLVEPWVFGEAQNKWQKGYCVAVAVLEGEEQRVMKGSETPFTAIVRHKFEGNELTVPVIASLTSGKVSVTPSGTKVPARATFRYKAPEEAGGEGATVELVSRSRRGIGKLAITFRTDEQFYTVNTAWAGSTIELTGTICAFDKPFTLKLGGHKPGGMPYTGKVEFTPKDAAGGSWKATGTYGTPDMGTTNDSGGSTYQVTGLADGKPEIVLNEFTQTGVIRLPPEVAAFFHAPPIITNYHWPGMQIPLISETGACSSD